MSLTDLVPASFQPYEGSAFDVNGQELVLFEVAAPAGPDARPFSVYFTGSPQAQLEQQIHVLRHSELGDLELFLVAIGPGHYEAAFG